ncbi:tripartite motif-containing protein 16-like [Genypterus blacodes]|uniref:tripartite motif-containing protein 16-like n=1 Tax=Genypterus blacodes TaxID=154954 RepID=UPI003F768FE4
MLAQCITQYNRVTCLLFCVGTLKHSVKLSLHNSLCQTAPLTGMRQNLINLSLFFLLLLLITLKSKNKLLCFRGRETQTLTELRGEMAQQGIQMDQERTSCSICLDLLKEPVTIPCGHSYCRRCINNYWDGEEEEEKIPSCPQCRQTFTPRPVLVRNTMLADLVEELKKTELQAAPADHCYAGPADVGCDFCTGIKLKAINSCLQCVASYCEQHLQPHYDSATFKKHKLVEPSNKLQENICSLHHEVMKMFCRTDQQCICYLCPVDEHEGHHTVSAAVERKERQRELGESRQQVQQRIQDRQKDVKVLQQEVKDINQSADKAVRDSEENFSQLIRLMEKRSSDVKQQIRSQQKTEVSGAEELQEKLEQEITELRRKDAELQQLSHTEDHIQFLHNYPSLPHLSESTHSASINIRPLRHFEEVTAAVSKVRDQLQDMLSEGWTKISLTLTDLDVSLSPAEPKTRAGFLRYSQEIIMDPNTAHTRLLLSEGNRKVTWMNKPQSYSDHPDRFTGCAQVLSTESLTGRCYWEVERSGEGVGEAVTYKDIKRGGGESGFGYNEKSWSLHHNCNSCSFIHNSINTPLSVSPSSRVGVYLDQPAGLLSFYSVSDTMTLLHRVQTTFTQPLYAGIWLWKEGDNATLCKL